MRLATGTWSRIIVGSIPAGIAREIGASKAIDVYLSRETYFHIRDKHPSIPIADFAIIPNAIARGLVVLLNDRPNSMTVCYQCPDQQKRYAIPIKATLDGQEIYMQSFHRMRPRQTRSFLMRGRAIRFHQ